MHSMWTPWAPLPWLCWGDPTAQGHLHGLPTAVSPPRREDKATCAPRGWPGTILVPSQQKEVACRVAVGTCRCGTVGAKVGGHHQDNSQLT